MTEEQYRDLKDRVYAFLALELPGQPMMMHMGTSYLVQDLWNAIRDLIYEQAGRAD